MDRHRCCLLWKAAALKENFDTVIRLTSSMLLIVEKYKLSVAKIEQ